MYSENEFDLNSDERAALAALPREMEPGTLLERRVLRSLKAEGHFSSSNPGERRALVNVLKIAAAIAIFAGGVATGHYVIEREARQTASDVTPRNNVAPATHDETIVAEREIWL